VKDGAQPIQNAKGSVLPATGGMGTTIFYVVGGVLVVAAVVLFITKKRLQQMEA
jgi:LPXTG-motif cell wall-anchored protein